MKVFYPLFLILLSCNLGYSYISLDPNVIQYGNLKFNKTLSGSDDVLSDSAVVLNEGDVMVILRFTTSRSYTTLDTGSGTRNSGGLYVYTKSSMEDEILTPVNAYGYGLNTISPPGNTRLVEYLEGTFIVGPKIVYIAWRNHASEGGFAGSNNDVTCEMDYAIQRKRTVNPQPVSQ